MNSEPIAVTGISALFAGSPDLASFWRNVCDGRDLISDVPPSHWLSGDYYDPDPQVSDKVYCRRGSFLDPVGFDALHFGLPPSNVPATDTSQLLALILAERLFQDISPDSLARIDRERISVILGVTGATELTAHMSGRMARPQWEQGLRDSGLSDAEVTRIADRISAQFVPWQESTFPGLLGNVVAGRIANRFDLGGTNCIVDAACASSLGALSMAMNELHLGQSDLVITGGVDTLNDPLMYLCFSKTPALSLTGDCRPFSDQSDGTLLGEGLAMLALRRLSDAERDGDRIYAVIKGLGTSSDGRSKSVYAPRSAGQARALRRAYVSAGYGPSSVELVEAHGTATRAGDLAEFEGLRTVFAEQADSAVPWCALGSIKSQIGHTKAAAGVAGLAKAILALHHKVLPPTIKVRQPNPQFDIEHSPFYLNTEPRPWVRGADHPRRASVSSFGFGGSNFHVALEEYTGSAAQPERFIPSSAELILVSAMTNHELQSQLKELIQECDADATSADALRRLAQRSRRNFQTSHPLRCAIVVEALAKLRERLGVVADHLKSRPAERIWSNDGVYYDVNRTPGKIAWLFPGQGSQYVGMGRDLAMSFDSARQVWDRAASMDDQQDLPLHKYVFPAPAFSDEVRAKQAGALRRMEVAQPAIAACSLAYARVLESFQAPMNIVAGHSFGELTALCAAGAIDEPSLLRLARRRGNAMMEASGTGTGMTAVHVSADELNPLLDSYASRVVLANRNGLKQMVVSGECSGLEQLEAEFSRRKWSFRRLDVDAACHSPWMRTAVTSFFDSLGQISMTSSRCPVGWNATGQIWSGTTDELKFELAHQLVREVRFHDMVETLYATGARTFIEVGPAAVLTGLVNESLAGRDVLAVSMDRKGSRGLVSFWQALGQLAVRGVSLDWSAAEKVFSVSKAAPLPIDERRTISICGANSGKPYPSNRSQPASKQDRVEPYGIATPPRQVFPSENHGIAAPTPAARVDPAQTIDRHFNETAAPEQLRFTEQPIIMNDESIATEFVGDGHDRSTGHHESPFMHDPTNDPWLIAFREVQQQTADAHQMYLQSISVVHRTFLQASLGQWVSSPEIEDLPLQNAASRPVTTRSLPTAMPMSAPTPIPRTAVPAVNNLSVAKPVSHVSNDSVARPIAEQKATVSETILPSTRANAASSNNASSLDLDVIRHLVLEVVADKTGYSVEVLDPALDIEAGLGIDSIKRVEILSNLVERLPQLDGMDLTEFATYQTLGDVMSAVEARMGSLPVPTVLQATIAAPLPVDIRTILLEVVAEKTGYPQDLIDLDMDIESGLGIDSIKRVEILSSLIDRFPELSSVDAMEFNSQRTLGELLAKVAAQFTNAQLVNPVDNSHPAHAMLEPDQTAHQPTNSAVPTICLKVRSVKLTESAASGFALPGIKSGASIAIIAGSDADDFARQTSHELRQILKSRGIEANAVEMLPQGVNGVIHLGGLAPCSNGGAAAARTWEVCEVAQRLRRSSPNQPVVFVTVQDTGGHFGHGISSEPQALNAGLAGLAKTALCEWPEASIKAIDLERHGRTPQSAAKAIADELLFGGTELEVAISVEQGRATLCCRDWPPAPAVGTSPRTSQDDVLHTNRSGRPTFVVSGGAKGVTAAALLAIAKRIQPRFILLGRTPLDDELSQFDSETDEPALKHRLIADAQKLGPPVDLAQIQIRARRLLSQREIQQTIDILRAAGSDVRYCAVDVRNKQQLSISLAGIRQIWGPIAGIIHGAGVLADKRIVDKQSSQFQEVFQTKVEGLQTLLDVTRLDPLKWIVLFSSITARLGNAGQSDYAAANEVLNKLAHHESRQRGDACRVLSINWGAWNGGMVDDSLRGHFEKQGVSLIPLESGAELFADLLLQHSKPPVEIVVTAEARPDTRLHSPVPACHDRAAMELSADRFPFICSHRVKDAPVLPMVLVVEWFARALRQRYPYLTLIGLHDLKILKGVSLADAKAVRLLTVVFAEACQNGTLTLQVELRGANDILHYRCLAELASGRVAVIPPRTAPPVTVGPGWPWTVDQAYKQLFHGPDFHVLRTLDTVNETGASATLVGTRSMCWQGGPWSTDPAALDGGLQVAVLWGIHRRGRMSLPSAIKSVHFHHPTEDPQLIHCEVTASTIGAHQHTFDIRLTTPAGEPIFDLLDVDMTLLKPGLQS